MTTVTVEQFHSALKAQGVSSVEDVALVCPVCGQVQSARDLIKAGAGANFEEVEKYLGFSCVGRWTGAGPADFKNNKPRAGKVGCDWTLGGFLRLHKLEVVAPDGEKHPRFEPATPEQATQHALT